MATKDMDISNWL